MNGSIKRQVAAYVCCLLLLGCQDGGSSSDTVAADDRADVGAGLPPASTPDLSETVIVAEAEFDPHWNSVGVYANAESCAACHRASSDGSGVMRLPPTAQGDDISPSAGWRHSMMAQAWNDPYFQAVVEDQAREFPGYAGDIEDKCLGCHSPMAHSQAHRSGLGLSSTDCSADAGCYRIDTASRDDHAREGVSCTLCHQMVDDAADQPGSGNYVVPGDGEARARTIYGPYLNPRSRPMEINTGYRVSQASYISSSEHCASCHDLDTPTFDINTGHPAQPAALFREQSAYSEWLNSRYGDGDDDDRSCQSCHMQGPENYRTAIAVNRSGMANPAWPERSPFSLHGVSGGNTYVLGLLKTWRRELGIEQSTTADGFDRAIASGRSFLRQAAELALVSASRGDQDLQLALSITNRTGHKLPTGYPSRRMWLQLTVADAAGRVLFESGRPDELGRLSLDHEHLAPGCLASPKADSFDNGGCYEQHRDTISSPDQVAIYESVMADTNAQITYRLLYGAGYLKDNRIPPAGFTRVSANYDEATAIVGLASSDDDFNRASGVEGSGIDTVHYRISLPDGVSGRLSVEARLWYQSIRPAFVAAMPNRGDKVARLQLMVQRQAPQPELLAQVSEALE